MTTARKYAFSDLTLLQVEALKHAARVEQAKAIRSFFARLFRVTRRREAQVWPPKNVPALSLKTYC
jgi:hypothetical protein